MNVAIKIENSQSYDRDLVDGVSIFLRQLAQEKFFGSVTLQFSEGQLILVRQETTMKPLVFLK